MSDGQTGEVVSAGEPRRHRITLGKTSTAILAGDEDLSLWDDEELRRGYRRDKNGIWSGRKPKVVPRAIHDELVRRTLDEAGKVLQDSLVDAVQLYRQVVRDPEAPLNLRLQAADKIVERVMGKAPVTIKAHVTADPWDNVLEGVVVEVSEVDRDKVLRPHLPGPQDAG